MSERRNGCWGDLVGDCECDMQQQCSSSAAVSWSYISRVESSQLMMMLLLCCLFLLMCRYACVVVLLLLLFGCLSVVICELRGSFHLLRVCTSFQPNGKVVLVPKGCLFICFPSCFTSQAIQTSSHTPPLTIDGILRHVSCSYYKPNEA